MNQIEEITLRYLTSYLGDLSEATEDNVIDAISRINLITRALNEQVNMRDVVQKELGKTAKGSRRPPRQDEIEAIYSTYDGSDEKPYQGPGGKFRVGNVQDPKIDTSVPAEKPFVDYEGIRAGQHGFESFKSGVDKFVKGITIKSPDGMVDAEAAKKHSDELDKMGVDRLKKYGEMTRSGDMSMDEFEGKYRTLSRRSAERRGPEAVAAVEKLHKADDQFKKDLPNLVKLGADYEEAKAATDRAELEAGRGTLAGERRIDQILSKPGGNKSSEEARQKAIASRQRMADQDKAAGLDTAAGDPDTFQFYQDRGIKPTGTTDSGEPAYTLDDRLKYQVQQRTKELTGGRPATRYGSNLYVEQYTGSSSGPTGRVNVIDVGAERETGRRMRGPSSSGYPSRFPGSMVGPADRPRGPRVPVDPERQRAASEWLAAQPKVTPEQREANARRRELRRDLRGSEEVQSAVQSRVSEVNADRARRKLPPINSTVRRRIENQEIANQTSRLRDRQTIRDADSGTNVTPQSEEDYMSSVFPERTVDSGSLPGGEGAPLGAKTTFTGPGGAGFSTVPPRFSTLGILNNMMSKQGRPTQGMKPFGVTPNYDYPSSTEPSSESLPPSYSTLGMLNRMGLGIDTASAAVRRARKQSSGIQTFGTGPTQGSPVI